jgi:hypothetical protein
VSATVPGIGGRRASARLGLTLRSVLLSPRDGFRAAMKALARRAAAGERPAAGYTPYVLAAIGGAAAAVLWLKVGAIAGTRDVARASYRWDFVVATLVLGAVVALIAQAMWGVVGTYVVRALGGNVQPSALRLVWGAASLPHVVALLVLLPLDLVIAGPDALTSERLADPLATVWSALSLSLGLALGAWSLFLIERGVETASGLRSLRASVGVIVAIACLAAVVGGTAFGLVSLAGTLT